MITCRNCQNEELPGALYCSECGERLKSALGGSSRERTSQRPSRPQGPIYAGPPSGNPPRTSSDRSESPPSPPRRDYPREDRAEFDSPLSDEREHPRREPPEDVYPSAPPRQEYRRPEAPTHRSPAESADKPEASRPSPARPSPTPKRQQAPSPSQPGARQPEPARVALRVIHHPEEIPLQGKTEFTLGRVNEGQPIIPDIDLSAYNAYDNGVSRLHATIHIEPQVTVTDLGSINGTRINGNKTQPHTPAVLHDGDTLALGRLKLRVIIRSA